MRRARALAIAGHQPAAAHRRGLSQRCKPRTQRGRHRLQVGLALAGAADGIDEMRCSRLIALLLRAAAPARAGRAGMRVQLGLG
jgi:hypothetical protein